MMKKTDNFSRTIKVGRIAHRTDLYTDPNNGKQYIRFNLAINKNKDKPDYYACVVYSEPARYFDRHIRIGDKVLVVGTDDIKQKQSSAGMNYKSQQVIADAVYLYDSDAARKIIDEMQNMFSLMQVVM